MAVSRWGGAAEPDPGAGAASALRILVVDDEPMIGELVAAAARNIGMVCTATRSAAQFRAELAPDVGVVVVDLLMPDTDGVELLRELGAAGCRAQVVLMSGFDRSVLRASEELARSFGLATAGSMQKPFRMADAEAVLARACMPAGAAVASAREFAPVSLEDVHRAIAHDAIVMCYQPQINLSSGCVDGIEAFARMPHPSRGLLTPQAFVPVAEQHGLIAPLTAIVLRHAIAEFGAMQRPSTCTLSIKVAAPSLTDLDFPDRLRALARDHGIEPWQLVLQVSGGGLVREVTTALDILARLRMHGVGLSLDDFGTGYSSIAQLRRIPATELKIDRSFVHDMLTDERAMAVINSTIELGHELDMTVVASGVETAAQAAALTARGCDLAQGFFFGPPLPIHDLALWIRQGERAPLAS